MSSLGLVAIGRNEGDRLRQCLQSVRDTVETVVYVDSGSTDGSVEMARSLGVEVVELNLDLPF
ncbi:MAG: glycosyltransferase, partial [Spirulinaceae cyanobacterium]